MPRVLGIAFLVLAFSALALADNSHDLTNRGGRLCCSLGTYSVSHAGGSYMITENATKSIPEAILFNGTFSRPAIWSVTQNADGTYHYLLKTSGTGLWYTGQKEAGTFVDLAMSPDINRFSGSRQLASGAISRRTVVPEPGTLGLLGTGLVGLAGLLRLKAKG